MLKIIPFRHKLSYNMANYFSGVNLALAELSSDSKARALFTNQVCAGGGSVMTPRPGAFFGSKGSETFTPLNFYLMVLDYFTIISSATITPTACFSQLTTDLDGCYLISMTFELFRSFTHSNGISVILEEKKMILVFVVTLSIIVNRSFFESI